MSILSTLPSVHSTVLGLFGAFYVAYCSYSVAKKDELREGRLEQIEKLSYLSAAAKGAAFIRLRDNSPVKPFASKEDAEAFILFVEDSLYTARQNPILTRHEKVEVCATIFNTLRAAFLAPPFNGRRERSKERFPTFNSVDIKDLEMSEVRKLVMLADTMHVILHRLREDLAKFVADAQLGTHELRERLIELELASYPPPRDHPERNAQMRAAKNSIKEFPDFEQLLKFHADILEQCLPEIALIEASKLKEVAFDRGIDVVRHSKPLFVICGLLLLFGVFVPPLLEDFRVNCTASNSCPQALMPFAVDYWLLFLTALPYFMGLMKFWELVQVRVGGRSS